MVSETIKVIRDAEQEAERIVAEGKAARQQLLDSTEKNVAALSEREISDAKRMAQKRLDLAEAKAKERKIEAMKKLQPELEVLREKAKTREKEAIQKIIDAIAD